MDHSLVWLIAGLILIGTEIATGTFYLLVLGIASLVAALVAYLGMNILIQAVTASVISVVGVFIVNKWRKQHKSTPGSNNTDIGQTVIFLSWISESSRIARVKYRDTNWEAEVLADTVLKENDLLWICGASGNQLQVTSIRPKHPHMQ